MEFTLLFLGATLVMLLIMRAPRSVSLTLFAVLFCAAAGTYLHHATDKLKLSF